MAVAIETSNRPTGRDEVRGALKSAAYLLLRDKGLQFSVREVAAAADVNQGLIYRHFGSKENLISETLTDTIAGLSEQLDSGVSPVDLMVTRGSDAAMVLARLVLDDATALVAEQPALEALTNEARTNESPGGPSAETRAAIASATLLGWALFGRYLTEESSADHDVETLNTLRDLTTQLLTGPWPASQNDCPPGQKVDE